MLLDAGADVHANHGEALRMASESGHAEVVKILLNAGADVHARNGTFFESALKHDRIEIANLLQEAGLRAGDQEQVSISRTLKLR